MRVSAVWISWIGGFGIWKFQETEAWYEDDTTQIAQRGIRRREFGRFIRSVEGMPESITEFSEELWGSMVDHVTVNSKDNIVFTLTGGMEIDLIAGGKRSRKVGNMTQKVKNTENSMLRTIIVVISVCIVFAIMQGVHDNYGIMLNALIDLTGLDYASVSFVIGVGALLYGVAQPFMGMLALKKSNSFVMLVGIAMISGGLILTTFSRSFLTLLLAFGIILPIGTTGLASGILMSAITPVIGSKRAVIVSGFLQASAGVGDALMAPGMERLISSNGISFTLVTIAIPFIVMIPIALWIGRLDRKAEQGTDDDDTKDTDRKGRSLKDILSEAFKDRDYRLILIGFATCGFNMSIIESHLFSQYLSYGIPGSISSLTLTAYGITTMLGAILTGFLGSKLKMKNVLGTVYLIRVFISVGFLILPKSIPFAFVMTGLLGLTGDSTVPPTMGTITRKFGAKEMAVLYGFALVGHQIGAFASASLGGQFVKAGMGYAPLWVVNMILAAVAAVASYKIREYKDTP